MTHEIDRAIEQIDRDIAHAEAQLAILHATRVRLVAQQHPEPTPADRRLSSVERAKAD